MRDIQVSTLEAPTVAALFSMAFLAVRLRWRTIPYLPWLASAFGLFSMAMLCQVLQIPRDFGWNAVISCAVYLLAAGAFTKACLMRLGIRPYFVLNTILSLLVLAGTGYYFFVDRNLLARIYVLNLGLGTLLLIAALQMRSAARKTIDKILFGSLLGFSLHFFPRTIFSLGTVGRRIDPQVFAKTPFWAWLNYSLLVFTVLLGAVLLGAVVSDLVEPLRRAVITDPLTGLMNRRGLEQFTKDRSWIARLPTAVLIVCDIDRFKSINDTFGHQNGDSVLVTFAEILRTSIQSGDLAARLGGEEFILLLTQTDIVSAYAFVEHLREIIATTRFGSGSLRRRKITASFGMVEFGRDETLEQAIHRADNMLYEAKRDGRNRTAVDWVPTGIL